jgi:hypothetical protein
LFDLGTEELYTMNADGTALTQLTDGDGYNFGYNFPDWQPLNRRPTCSLVRAAPNALTPAGGIFRLVTLSGATDPDGDRVTLRVGRVTQDEPVRTSPGDASFPDARRSSRPNEVYVRAERRSGQDGRVYRISFVAADGRGGNCFGMRRIRVPAGATDSAPPSYDSFSTG